jgi:outer membrane protein assembly factor BamD (BamD/ComL family)
MCSKNLTRTFSLAVLFAVLLGTYVDAAETLHLGSDGQWKNAADEPGGKFLLAASKIKQVIDTGDTESALQCLTQLKVEFPDIAGPDLEVFTEAELLYAKGKWNKAVRKYDQLLDSFPDSWLYASAIERQFSVATAFLTGEKRIVLKYLKLSAYEEGEKIMHKIADRTGDAPIAKRALRTVAEGYETRGKFLDAYEAWAEISTRWPTGQMAKEALLRMAQDLHSAYKSPKYDSSSLLSAKSYYNDFKIRHPQLKGEHKIDDKINMIDEQLAYKQFRIGQYYDRADSPQAANIYYQYVIDSWPDSAAAKMAKAKIEENNAPAAEAAKKDRKLGRKLFDAGSNFLDKWPGLVK